MLKHSIRKLQKPQTTITKTTTSATATTTAIFLLYKAGKKRHYF